MGIDTVFYGVLFVCSYFITAFVRFNFRHFVSIILSAFVCATFVPDMDMLVSDMSIWASVPAYVASSYYIVSVRLQLCTLACMNIHAFVPFRLSIQFFA